MFKRLTQNFQSVSGLTRQRCQTLSSHSHNYNIEYRSKYFGSTLERTKVIIVGAAGRDFHNFNTVFRGNPNYDVIAFTAHQIPGIEGRTYPCELAGNELYPNGIPIYDESELERLILKHNIDNVAFSYSDLSHNNVMHIGSRALSCGANYMLLGPKQTQIKSTKPVISVVASRTGCGKSQTSRYIVETLLKNKMKVVAIRHPMPYGDLLKQRVQRYATYDDLIKYECTIEEREEYEPYVTRGAVIYAGVDYNDILNEAQKEADIILWDGGNNDMSFYVPDLQVCVVDPHRVGDEMLYHPGETNVRMSDILLINKVDTASQENVQLLKKNCKELNPNAVIIEAESPLTVKNNELIKGKRVLVVEDGPTLTHGGMAYGAGIVAAKKFGAKECIDPRPFLKGTLKETFNTYPKIGKLLPAMGYGDTQINDLESTINASDADVVVSGTPIDISKVVNINKPIVNVQYDLKCIGGTDLVKVIQDKLQLL